MKRCERTQLPHVCRRKLSAAARNFMGAVVCLSTVFFVLATAWARRTNPRDNRDGLHHDLSTGRGEPSRIVPRLSRSPTPTGRHVPSHWSPTCRLRAGRFSDGMRIGRPHWRRVLEVIRSNDEASTWVNCRPGRITYRSLWALSLPAAACGFSHFFRACRHRSHTSSTTTLHG